MARASYPLWPSITPARPACGRHQGSACSSGPDSPVQRNCTGAEGRPLKLGWRVSDTVRLAGEQQPPSAASGSATVAEADDVLALLAQLQLQLQLAQRDAEEQRAVAAAAQRDAEAKDVNTFFVQLRAVSASASGAQTSDTTRRGLPPHTFCENLLDDMGFPVVPAETIQRQWGVFRAAFSRRKVPTGTGLERKYVHPVMALVIRCAMPERPWLRYAMEVTVRDSIDADNMIPDLLFVEADDKAVSPASIVISGEVKLPGNLEDAMLQAGNYARRCLEKGCTEAHSRGDDMSGLFACFIGLTNKVSFGRVQSGAPRPGESFANARPCPSQWVPEADLFGVWDFKRAYSPPEQPPAGFALLVRILAAPKSVFGPRNEPLQAVQVQFEPPAASLSGHISLSKRLGAGGTSDVYDAHGPGIVSGAALKLPRSVTPSVVVSYNHERAALTALREAGCNHLPMLLAVGERLQSTRLQGAPRLQWPVLLLSPQGEVLADVAAARLRALPAGAPAEAALCSFAHEVLDGVLTALRTAHAAGWAHCDLRAANVVWVDGTGAAVVDWGEASHAAGYADEAAVAGARAAAGAAGREQLGPDKFRLACAKDILGAALLWLQIAFGSPLVRPPWGKRDKLQAWLLTAPGAAAALRDCMLSRLLEATASPSACRTLGDLSSLYDHRSAWFDPRSQSADAN